MRKRSSYRPRPVLRDPVGFVTENIRSVAHHESYLVDLKIKNHGAMTALTRGQATRKDMDTLIALNNITEALFRMGFGKEYADVRAAGHHALVEVARRGAAASHWVVRASEMTALNTMMELHDAQMDVITVKDMEAAIALAKHEQRHKRTTRIIEVGMSA